MSTRGSPVFTFSLPGERLAPLPTVCYATGCNPVHNLLRTFNWLPSNSTAVRLKMWQTLLRKNKLFGNFCSIFPSPGDLKSPQCLEKKEIYSHLNWCRAWCVVSIQFIAFSTCQMLFGDWKNSKNSIVGCKVESYLKSIARFELSFDKRTTHVSLLSMFRRYFQA